MNDSVFGRKIYLSLLSAYRWYLLTPERALEEAYKSALKIQDMERQHFNGNKISRNADLYSSSVMDYFQSDLNKLLKNVRMRLTEFKASRWFSNESKQAAADKAGIEYSSLTIVLQKLDFIDQVVNKYKSEQLDTSVMSFINESSDKVGDKGGNQGDKPKRKADSTSILPRSIFTTISRLQTELDPNAEVEVVRSFRQTQKMTIISIRFILLLIIIPLLTHQISKVLVVGPIVDSLRHEESEEIFINEEMEEEALTELEKFAERIKFESMITNAPPLSSIVLEAKMSEKAQEIAREFRQSGSNAIKNVFCDLLSVFAFIFLMLTSRSSILVLKDFFDYVVYGLSDSAKAFIIILFTDIFVGFHSPHGWEVILEGLSHHWGLPANRDFIFLFIATFPVILDTIFKYWIFRYLNRISPSAVATYHNMNE
ncbi:proton extrusion protein PcxA [Cylindrospermopsis raciborskii]|uniref:proton extrusion protein PcxA n=1 Tax=Cylindrospermopsis raciborskii TaxID=77022 RepID=UPI000778AEF1|nr:proton extrusion protein PcxA [Cylindrospermopsis raciborskii]MCZ2201544.1 proton extrusion protein PcxA [Cylindrospermopsis raciborskii PAMP2012]MCZ2204598.1 proton extrusion protein PcxA [Cylindrospermopsis raciborskii PAMP2011]